MTALGPRRSSASHDIDKRQRSGRLLVAAPRHVLVRAHQHEPAPVEVIRLRWLHIQNRQRHPPVCRSSNEARDGRRRVESKQGVGRTQGVVKRPAAFEPEVGCATSRNCGRGERAHGVGRLLLAVVGDDRRTIVVVAEIQAAAALLFDVERISFLADARTRGISHGILPLDIRGYAMPLQHDPLCDIGDQA